MKKTVIKKHISGYTVEFFLFILFVPALIQGISQIKSPLFQTPISTLNFITYIIATPFFVIGVIFAIWSNIELFKIGKGGPADIFNIAISPRSKKLVTVGPYRYTRNPMVFGMTAIYFSIALYLNALMSLIFVILFLSAISIYLKLTEEKRLLRDFGDEYLHYKNNVSMMIPFPSKQINKP